MRKHQRRIFFSGKENLKFITSLFHIAGLIWDVQKAHTNLKMHEFCSVITIWCQKDLPLLRVTNCSSDGSSEVQNEIPLRKDWLFRLYKDCTWSPATAPEMSGNWLQAPLQNTAGSPGRLFLIEDARMLQGASNKVSWRWQRFQSTAIPKYDKYNRSANAVWQFPERSVEWKFSSLTDADTSRSHFKLFFWNKTWTRVAEVNLLCYPPPRDVRGSETIFIFPNLSLSFSLSFLSLLKLKAWPATSHYIKTWCNFFIKKKKSFNLWCCIMPQKAFVFPRVTINFLQRLFIQYLWQAETVSAGKKQIFNSYWRTAYESPGLNPGTHLPIGTFLKPPIFPSTPSNCRKSNWLILSH